MIEVKMFGWFIAIEGFRNVKIENIDAFFNLVKEVSEGCFVQLLNAKMVAGFNHLYFAVLNALKAFEVKHNISKNIGVEVLLFASVQHQIKNALEILGLKRDSSEIIVLVVADTHSKIIETLHSVSNLMKGEVCNKVIELTDEKVHIIREAFDISDLEIEATLRTSEKESLSSILIEHVALMVTHH